MTSTDTDMIAGYGALVEPRIMGELRTPDDYWRVEVVRYGKDQTWYRVWHATTLLQERASLSTVQRILGDDYATLRPAADDDQRPSASG